MNNTTPSPSSPSRSFMTEQVTPVPAPGNKNILQVEHLGKT